MKDLSFLVLERISQKLREKANVALIMKMDVIPSLPMEDQENSLISLISELKSEVSPPKEV